MKTFVMLSLMLSANAFAAEITLAPGSTATISARETSTVYCEGSADVAPRCTFKANSNGYLEVYIGENRAVTVFSTAAAVNEIKSYRAAGICR